MLTRAPAGALVLLLAVAPTASADPWGDVECGQGARPVCEVGAGIGHRPGVGVAHPGDPGQVVGDVDDPYVDCRHVPVDYSDPAGDPEGPGGWFMVLCSPDGKDPLSHGPVWVAEGGAPVLSPEQVAQIARDRLRLPEPRIARNPVELQLVHLPTWLWLAGGWEENSAEAAVPGVAVTAVARPRSVVWTLGDGSTVTCAGPGTSYAAGVDPRSSSPDCGHTYRRSSAGQAGGAFTVTATVHWTVTWSGAGQNGAFPDLTTTGGAEFRVAESQALNSGG